MHRSMSYSIRPRSRGLARRAVLATVLAVVLLALSVLPAYAASEGVQTATKSVVSIGVTFNNQDEIAGSGVVIGSGVVLTNNHVIVAIQDFVAQAADAGVEVNAWVNDGDSNRPAYIVATDELADLGLLRVRGLSLPAIQWGDSSAVQEGDEVFTLGFPGGLKKVTVGKGIVSQPHQTVDGRTYIQTDARISPGNSGGALVDANGLFLGVNTATSTQAEDAGLVVPAKDALAFIQDEAPDVASEIQAATDSNSTSDGDALGALIALTAVFGGPLCCVGLLVVIVIVVIVVIVRRKKKAPAAAAPSPAAAPAAAPAPAPQPAPAAPVPPAPVAPATAVPAPAAVTPGTVVSSGPSTVIAAPADTVSVTVKTAAGETAKDVKLPAVFGRAPECDVVIEDSEISRRHFELSRADGQLTVTDLKSSNGTKVNGEKVGSAPVKSGDVIAVGTSEVRIA